MELRHSSGAHMEQGLLSQQLRSGPSVLKNREFNFLDRVAVVLLGLRAGESFLAHFTC